MKNYINFGVGLYTDDKINYAHLFGKMPPVTPDNTEGRGIIRNPLNPKEVLEFQTARCFESENADEEKQKFMKLSAEIAEKFPIRARGIESFDDMGYESANQNNQTGQNYESYENTASETKNYGIVRIGRDAAGTGPAEVDFNRTVNFMICGAKQSGKTNLLKVIMSQCIEMNHKIFFIDTVDKKMQDIADTSVVQYISETKEIYNLADVYLYEDFLDRVNLVKENGGQERVGEILYNHGNVIVFISDFADFINRLYADDGELGTAQQLFEHIMGNSPLKISFVARISTDEPQPKNRATYDKFISFKKGVLLGNIKGDEIFGLPNSENEPGSGYLVQNKEQLKIITPKI